MVARGAGGRVINIASISALVANRGIAGRHYETSKAAVLHVASPAAGYVAGAAYVVDGGDTLW
jgi:NADP-dependent 3-hydroxy acid dehydrogenase YdfG